MISKINSSPSFGMAFNQDKVLGPLQTMTNKSLGQYYKAATGINELSNKHDVDIYVRGIEKVVEGATEPVIESYKLLISGKGEDAVSIASDIAAEKMPANSRDIKKFFKGMEGDIEKIGILNKIKDTFGI